MLVFIVLQFHQYTDEILTPTKSQVVKSYNSQELHLPQITVGLLTLTGILLVLTKTVNTGKEMGGLTISLNENQHLEMG